MASPATKAALIGAALAGSSALWGRARARRRSGVGQIVNRPPSYFTFNPVVVTPQRQFAFPLVTDVHPAFGNQRRSR